MPILRIPAKMISHSGVKWSPDSPNARGLLLVTMPSCNLLPLIGDRLKIWVLNISVDNFGLRKVTHGVI